MVPCSVFAFSQFKKLKMLLLAAGFILSLFGSIPPGLISLSVSQASISRGLSAAMALASGAALAEFFQAWAAVVLTDWFLSHPAAAQGFHWAAVPVFFVIGFQLIFFAKPMERGSNKGTILGCRFCLCQDARRAFSGTKKWTSNEERNKISPPKLSLYSNRVPIRPPEKIEPGNMPRQFVKGMILSAFNLLAIPYWFVYCGWLRLEGWWKEGLWATLVFSFGVAIGTLFSLSLYAWLGQIILRRSGEVTRYANRFIGLIFLGLGIEVLWGLIK